MGRVASREYRVTSSGYHLASTEFRVLSTEYRVLHSVLWICCLLVMMAQPLLAQQAATRKPAPAAELPANVVTLASA